MDFPIVSDLLSAIQHLAYSQHEKKSNHRQFYLAFNGLDILRK